MTQKSFTLFLSYKKPAADCTRNYLRYCWTIFQGFVILMKLRFIRGAVARSYSVFDDLKSERVNLIELRSTVMMYRRILRPQSAYQWYPRASVFWFHSVLTLYTACKIWPVAKTAASQVCKGNTITKSSKNVVDPNKWQPRFTTRAFRHAPATNTVCTEIDKK